MGAPFGDPAVLEHQDLVGILDRGDPLGDEDFCTGKGSRRSWSCMYVSVSISTAEVVSSRTSTAGRMARALARAIRCFWPPDRPTPRSPTMVS